MRYCVYIFLFTCLTASAAAQTFSRADSLRGGLTDLRTCYDVYFYDLTIEVNAIERSIKGSNRILYHIEKDFDRFQIDLFENMSIDSILWQEKSISYKREFNAVFVEFPETQHKGKLGEVEVYYSGKPQVAENAPWDGGFVWEKDNNNNDWIGVACEGTGASL